MKIIYKKKEAGMFKVWDESSPSSFSGVNIRRCFCLKNVFFNLILIFSLYLPHTWYCLFIRQNSFHKHTKKHLKNMKLNFFSKFYLEKYEQEINNINSFPRICFWISVPVAVSECFKQPGNLIFFLILLLSCCDQMK